MIAFETDSTVKNGMGGIIKPIVVCDYCHARIEGSGNALWIPPLEVKGERFRFESPIFHTHKHCNRAFEAEYKEKHGFYGFSWDDLWKHLAQTLNNVVARDDRQAQRIFGVVERVVESGRKP